MVQTITSPGVSIAIEDDSIYSETFPSTVPLFLIATRSNKTLPDGTGTAAGTAESGVLRLITSQREALQTYGNPTFVTSGGDPVHGDETNEYGLHALWSFMQTASRAYVLRADCDLGGLIGSTTEPLGDPADGTYWIDLDTVDGGIYRRNAAGTAWVKQTTTVYTTAPGGGDGADGDWAIDYSTTNGTLKVKTDLSTWSAVGTVDLSSQAVLGETATNNTVWVADTAPTGAGANDYWWKTDSANGGFDLQLAKFRASDSTWVDQTIIISATTPTTLTAGTIWMDTSTFQADGNRPVKVSDGTTFSTATIVVDATAPTTDPSDGDLWYNPTIDFVMYREVSDAWVEIVTTTDADPTAAEKVISSTAPTSPAANAIWIDTSTTTGNLDNFPIINRWNGSAWEDITSSVLITDTFTAPTAVADGVYWINTGDPGTTYIVKQWDDTYEAPIVNVGGTALETFSLTTNRRWAPQTGSNFGRRSQRAFVTTKLQAAIVGNDDILSDAIYYQLIACPGYPELYDEMLSLNTSIKEVAFFLADPPARMIPSGVPTGKEITATTWKTNLNAASTTGEDGFTSSGTPYAAMWYPWALSTNYDGENVMVPPSTVALRTIAYNDQVAYPWFAPMGDRRGLVLNAGSVGYLTDDGDYQAINLTPGQRDTLYDLDINPIAFFANTGLRVWGQKTLYGVASALDRINVARLIVKMKYDLQVALRPYIGQPHDPITWASAKNQVERYLGGIRSLRGLYDYAVRVDEENNTAARIDANELWVDIAIKPVKAVEFIYVPIRVVDTGGDLDVG